MGDLEKYVAAARKAQGMPDYCANAEKAMRAALLVAARLEKAEGLLRRWSEFDVFTTPPLYADTDAFLSAKEET